MTQRPSPLLRPRRHGRRRARLGRFLRRALYVKAGLIALLGLAVGLVYLRLSAGPVSFERFADQVAHGLAERIGPGWTVTLNDTALQLEDGAPALSTAGLDIRNPDGALVVRAPYAIVSIHAPSLLAGRLKPRSIELRDLQLRASLNRDGSLSFSAAGAPAGEEAASPPGEADAVEAGPPATPDGPSPVAQAVASLLDSALESGIVGAIDRARLTNARLTLVDAQKRERVGFSRVDAWFERTSDQARRFALKLDGSRGPWRLNGDVETAADGRRTAAVNVEAVPIEDMLLVSGLAAFPGTTDLKLSGRVGAAMQAGRLTRLDGRLEASAGEVQIDDKDMPPIRVDAAVAEASWDEERRALALTNLAFRGGATDIRLSGVATGVEQGWRVALTGRDAVLSGASPEEPPIAVETIEANLIAPASGGVVVERLGLRGPALNAAMSGTLRTPADQGGIRLDIRGTGTDARTALRLWPVAIAVPVRRYLGENLRAGAVESVSMSFAMTADNIVKGANGGPIPDEAVKIDFALRGADLTVAEGLPPLTGIDVTGAVTGTRAALQASAARLQTPDGRSLALSGGTFELANYWPKDSVARIAVRAEGGADALVSFLHSPLLRDVARIEFDPAAVKGRVDLRFNLPLTLRSIPPLEDLPVAVTGALSDVGIDKAFGKERLEAANLALTYQSGALALKGEGRLSGSPATIDIRQPRAGAGEAVVAFALDEAARAKKGLSFGGLTGTLPMRVVLPLGGKPGKGGPRVEADLGKAAIENLLPGWSKPAGRPGRLAFTVGEAGPGGGTELRDLVLDSGPVQMRGVLSLNPEGAFEKADLSSLKLSPGDDMRAQVERSGGGYKVTVRGNVADARPLIRSLTAPAKGVAGGGRDLDLDLGINILTGHNEEALTNTTIKAATRNGELRQVQMTGRFRSAPVSAQTTRGARGPVLTLQSADAGATLRFLDIYKRMIGGALTLQATLGDAPQVGNVAVDRFALRDEPALRSIASQSPAGAPDEKGSPASRIVGGEVEFNRLRAEFTRANSRVEFRDAVIAGAHVGFTLGGWIDYGRDRADISGTFVPAYGLNNIFAQVPLFGPLLGGDRNEGLFAVNFRVSGAATAPTLTVNPLSAVAPGFLRKLFGAGSGDAASAVPLPSGER